MANLQRARTEQVNKESAARLAKQKADKAAADAKASQDAAVTALTDSKRKFDEQREQVTRLAAERDEAQAKLESGQTAMVGRPGRARCPGVGRPVGARLAGRAGAAGRGAPVGRRLGPHACR